MDVSAAEGAAFPLSIDGRSATTASDLEPPNGRPSTESDNKEVRC